MTHLAGLRLRNWMVYRGEHELHLGPGCYAVVAEDEQDARRSNYLGKSSYLAAIRYLLEGTRVADVDTLDQLISEGENDLAVDAELSDGLFISREKHRGKSSNLVVEIQGEDGGVRSLAGDEAQAEIDRRLGIGKEDRLTTCWADQGEVASIVKMTPGTLTETVERWLDLEKLIDAGDRVGVWLDTASQEHADAFRALTELEALASEQEIARLNVLVQEIEIKRAARKDEIAARRIERETYAERRTLAEAIDELEGLRANDGKATSGEPPVDATLPKKLEAATVAVAVARENDRGAQAERVRLKALAAGKFDGVCPVSPGFTCPAAVTINQRSEQNQRALDAAKAKTIETTEALGDARERLEGLRLVSRAEDDRKAAAADRRVADAARASRVEYLEKWTSERLAAGLVPLPKNGMIPPVLEELDARELVVAREELERRHAAAGRLAGARSLVDSTSGAARAHRLAAALLGPEGARRRAVTYAVDRIVRDANADLAKAGINLSVQAAWGREVGKLADQCPDCGCAYPKSATVKRCTRCGSPRGQKVKHEFRWRLSRSSGAARDLVGLALRCAAYRWLREHRGALWAVAALDEVTGQLDRAHRASVGASIRRLLVGTFEQAFVTAHDSGTLDSCDRRILVTGRGKWSTIAAV